MKNRRKNKWKTTYRMAAATLITSMLSCTLAGNVLAGPPAVATDEALYVNLDYYGSQTDASVVKGVSLNGQRTFTDYGNYTDVTNMSNYAEPVILEDGVTWQLPEDAKERFYYECQLDKDEIILPWNFDVSYKLNGMPKEAQELVNADGLVEMDIHCIPNPDAKDYYRNNMLLQVATMVNMEDVRSVEAPGSQTQALGSYKIVLFAAVPGEEKTFHVEISTEKFESMGLIMMMIPGTLDQMGEISDIREIKDTVGDSTDQLLDGMNEILDTLDRISGGMNAAQHGLEELQKARASFDASKDEISANADQSLDSLEAVNTKIGQLAPDINTNKESLDQINNQVNGMVKTLRHSSQDFFELAGRLGELEEAMEELRHDVRSSDQTLIKEHLQNVKDRLAELEDAISQIEDAAEGLPQDLEEADVEEQAQVVDDLLDEIYSVLDQLEPVVGSNAVDELRAELDRIANIDYSDSSAMKQLAKTAKKLTDILAGIRALISDAQGIISDIDVEEGLENGEEIADRLAGIMGNTELLIGNVNDLNRTVNDNKAGFDAMLDDAAASVDSINTGTNQLVSLLRTVQNTARANRSAVENGTKQTLDGLIDILEQASGTTGTTDKLQTANEDLRTSVKEELDKIQEDTNFLEMDTTQDMISFTSDKNPAPSSIQIILRTQEISEEDVNTNAIDIEPAPEDVGLWQRIANVFIKIWNSIKGLLS